MAGGGGGGGAMPVFEKPEMLEPFALMARDEFDLWQQKFRKVENRLALETRGRAMGPLVRGALASVDAGEAAQQGMEERGLAGLGLVVSPQLRESLDRRRDITFSGLRAQAVNDARSRGYDFMSSALTGMSAKPPAV